MGCGEPALCTSDFRLQLDVPATLTVDFDPIADGVQVPIVVGSSLREGERIQLEILDDTGTVVASTESAVDAAGVATFDMVTVPTPLATVRAAAQDICGAATVEQKVDVLAGAHCELALITTPLSVPAYAPLGVLAQQNDADPTLPEEQAIVATTARLGWTVELRERSPQRGDEVLAVTTQDAPTVMSKVTFHDGMTSVFATCVRSPMRLTSAALFTFVDSISPTCRIAAPVVSGSALLVSASVDDADVEGEPAQLTVTPVGGSPGDAGATPIAGGHTHGSVPAPSGQVDIAFSTHDHAGNPCSVVARF